MAGLVRYTRAGLIRYTRAGLVMYTRTGLNRYTRAGLDRYKENLVLLPVFDPGSSSPVKVTVYPVH